MIGPCRGTLPCYGAARPGSLAFRGARAGRGLCCDALRDIWVAGEPTTTVFGLGAQIAFSGFAADKTQHKNQEQPAHRRPPFAAMVPETALSVAMGLASREIATQRTQAIRAQFSAGTGELGLLFQPSASALPLPPGAGLIAAICREATDTHAGAGGGALWRTPILL